MEEAGKTSKSNSSNNNTLDTLSERLNTPVEVDLSQNSILRIAGPDAKSFLQGQLTCDINALSPTQAQLGAICTNKGRVLSVVTVVQATSEALYYLILPNNNHPPLLAQLKQFGHFSKVTIELDTHWQTHLGMTRHDAMPPFQSEQPNYHVVQTDDTLLIKLPGINARYLILKQQSHTGAPTNALMNTQYLTIWNATDILLGIPHIEPAITEQYTPHMLNLQKLGAISFTKGCYIGQEIIARTEHLGQVKKTAMIAYQAQPSDYQPGDPLYEASGKAIGTVLNAIQMDQQDSYLLIIGQLSNKTLPLLDKNQLSITLLEQ